MGRVADFLASHSLAVLALALAAWAGVAFARRRSFAALVGLIAAVAFAVGGLAVPRVVGMWVAGAGALALFTASAVLVIATKWDRWTATAFMAVLLLGLGGFGEIYASQSLAEAGRSLVSLEAAQPWWLLTALVLPGVVWVSRKSLSGLGPFRKYLAIGLRLLVLSLLILALAEVRVRRTDENTTVLFLVDRSLSIPQEVDTSLPEADAAARGDKRWRRIKEFLNDAVEKRGPGHERDQAGVIVFGRRPRLVLPPAEVGRLNFSDELIGSIDENYTDIAAAMKLALASFPEGTAKRIVLLSDGNENLGNALDQARLAKQNGVQIDTVPLAAGYRNDNEVLVQSVEAPNITEQGGRLPIRVLLRSYNPRTVTGTLAVRQLSEGQSDPVAIEAGPGVVTRGPPATVQLRPGLNSFSFRQTLAGQARSYTYQAIFQPLGVQSQTGELARLTGDRVQNNSATTHVVALGRRRVLFVEAKGKSDHTFLTGKLQGAGDTKFQVSTIDSKDLPTNKADLGVLLSSYDCVVLANVPAEELTEDQQEMIRSNTYDQGCGLVMLGGPESFGAGGYQSTPIEKALPVDCDIKSVKVAGKGGLVLIMHACEIADGNAIQKQLAKLSVQKLSANDMVGVIYYDFNTKWHVPFQTIGANRASIQRQVDRMTPGDMMDFDPTLVMAMKELSNPSHQLAAKHIILISDGDPQLTNKALLSQLKTAGITCTTIGVATHGAPDVQKMSSIANATGGKFYKDPNPKLLPAIYIQETRVVSQSFIHDKQFGPALRSPSGPADKLSAPLPPLYGFVRTTLKQSPLVEMAIEGPKTLDQEFPILAYWQYGLGKSVAWTSDARSGSSGKAGWDQDWANADLYTKFWEQVVGWAIRGVETGKLTMSTEYRDGKVRVIVDARDDKNRPLSDLRLQGKATAPAGPTGENASLDLKFEQKSVGRYEAEFKAEEAGSYFINALARRPTTTMRDGKPIEVEEADSIRSGVTVPYSPEFSDLESNTALLKRLSDLTEGEQFEETDAGLQKAARSGRVFRKTPLATRGQHPIWHWLVLVAGVVLLFDVAVRRIAIEPSEYAGHARKLWDKLRGRDRESAPQPAFIARLQNRKVQVGETIERGASTRRFEADPTRPVADAPPLVDSGLPPPPRRTAPPPTAKPAAEPENPFDRLMKAKKKALEGRDKPDDEPPLTA